MPDLDDLGSALLPGARRVGGTGAASPISWVRVMKARVPAFDALEPGDLAIVPASALAVVAPTHGELTALVDACVAARLAGLLLIDGDVAQAAGEETGRASATSLLDDLVAALDRVGMPALRMPRADPIALERSVIGFLVARGAELDRQAALLESRLERLALEGGGPAALVAAIGAFLGRAVALEGRRGDGLAVHAPMDVPDAVAAVRAYHARPREAVALRVALPAAAGSAVVAGSGSASRGSAGSLALLGERPAGELERVVAARIGALLALELARDEAIRRARDQARRAEVLPPAGPPWVVLLVRQRVPGTDGDAAEARDQRDAVRRELRLLAPARRLALRGDADSLEIRAVLAVDAPGPADAAYGDPGVVARSSSVGSDPEGLGIAARMASFLGRTVAISLPFTSTADRPTAEAEARATLESAEALAEPPAVARAARLPIYRMLGALHNLPEGERLARALLEPVLAGRPDVRREHLATLRALLDHGGVNEAAAALRVHRNTVAYRLRRIEERTGWHLSDPEIRLPLAIALRFVQND
ncbi:MAG: PucR family transcriptional regulator [Chloroflexi bacterium]|nr:PucR family transcriptional regulator [Chloroflexota bacterium]